MQKDTLDERLKIDAIQTPNIFNKIMFQLYYR